MTKCVLVLAAAVCVAFFSLAPVCHSQAAQEVCGLASGLLFIAAIKLSEIEERKGQ